MHISPISEANVEPTRLARAKKKDIERFSQDLSPAGAVAAAIVLEGMRRLQKASGPGHIPLDVAFSALPEAYRRNWAIKQLGKAA